MLVYLLATQKPYLYYDHSSLCLSFCHCDHSSTVYGQISRSLSQISLFLCSNLHLPRLAVTTHQFVMTFMIPDEFEQKDKVHVIKLKAPNSYKEVFNYLVAMNTLLWLLPSDPFKVKNISVCGGIHHSSLKL